MLAGSHEASELLLLLSAMKVPAVSHTSDVRWNQHSSKIFKGRKTHEREDNNFTRRAQGVRVTVWKPLDEVDVGEEGTA